MSCGLGKTGVSRMGRPVNLLGTVAEFPAELLMDGKVRRTAVRSEGALVVFNWIEPGHAEAPQHSHPWDQLSFVFQGTMQFDIGDRQHVLRAGDVVRIAPDVPHTARVLGDEVALNVDVFCPIRDDYRHLIANPVGEFPPNA